MKDVQNSLNDLTVSFKELVEQNQLIKQRLVVLERDYSGSTQSEEQRGLPQANSTSQQTASVEQNLQGDFTALKDTLAQVRLPALLKVPDSKSSTTIKKIR